MLNERFERDSSEELGGCVHGSGYEFPLVTCVATANGDGHRGGWRSNDPDVLRSVVKTMSEADTLRGAPYGECSNERTSARNGYRRRE